MERFNTFCTTNHSKGGRVRLSNLTLRCSLHGSPKAFDAKLDLLAQLPNLELFFGLTVSLVPNNSNAQVIPGSTITCLQGELCSSVRLCASVATASLVALVALLA